MAWPGLMYKQTGSCGVFWCRLARGGASNPNHARAIAQATGGTKSGWQSDKAFWGSLIKSLDKKCALQFC